MMRTLDFWKDMVQQHGQAIALENDGVPVSYAELSVAVNALAVALQSHDPTPGSRVALCAELSPEYVVSMLAIAAAGKVLIPLSCHSNTQTLHQLLNDTLCGTILVDDLGHEKIHADDDHTIHFSQFEGLVRTYHGKTPERHDTEANEDAAVPNVSTS